jgi:predicted AAA+ superfamily ATPase
MKNLLRRWNPWWEKGNVPGDLTGFPREKYLGSLVEQLDEDRVSVIVGPRRTGKSTLMFQTINALIETGKPPSRILYAMMDHPMMDGDIGKLVDDFRKLQKIPSSERLFIFLDEAQHVKDWARWAKALHDSKEAKLYVSGSTTAMLESDAFASLTGRWRKNRIWPLDLWEFIEFRTGAHGQTDPHVREGLFKDYLRVGGFPEAVLEPDESRRSRILVELFDDMIFKDAARTRSIRDTGALRQLAVFMAGSMGMPMSVNKVRRTFRLSADAVSGYIDALVGAHLFLPCQYHSTSVNERIYNPKKYYLIDPGMASAVIGTVKEGTAVENLLALHFYKMGDIRYWKSRYEVDFVLDGGKIALESKFRSKVSPKDIRGGMKFVRSHGNSELYVATKDLESQETVDDVKVYYLPILKILAASDHHEVTETPGTA